MEEIEYSDDFICPKCGCHTGLLFNLDGTVQAHCFRCNSYYDVKIKKETNADRIRAMSNEELARFIFIGCDGRKCVETDESESIPHQCERCWIDWLKQEADE